LRRLHEFLIKITNCKNTEIKKANSLFVGLFKY
jgi:hypothetical protein